jgi:hypothetical protein
VNDFMSVQELVLSELDKVGAQIRRTRNVHHRLRLYRRLVDLGHLGEALMRLTTSHPGGGPGDERLRVEVAPGADGGARKPEPASEHFPSPLALPRPEEAGQPAAGGARGRLLRQFQTFVERGRDRGRFIWEAGELEARYNRHIRGHLKRALASAGVQDFEALLLLCRQEGWLSIFSAGGKLYTYVRGASRNGNGGGG